MADSLYYETRALTFGSYKGKPKTMLTHTVRMETPTDYGTPLCKRISEDATVDHFGMSEEERAARPTCPVCLKRDPRFTPNAAPHPAMCPRCNGQWSVIQRYGDGTGHRSCVNGHSWDAATPAPTPR